MTEAGTENWNDKQMDNDINQLENLQRNIA